MMGRPSNKTAVQRELEAICKKHGGVLRPADVVAEAQANKSSALHTEFNWDIKEAAYAHWLDRARNLIRVHVIVMPSPRKWATVMPEFQSLSTERGASGGYRTTVDVMGSPDTRAQLLKDTVSRLVSIKEIALFSELNDIRVAIDQARKRYL